MTEKIIKVFNDNTNTEIIVTLEVGFVLLTIYLVVIRLLFMYLEKLFTTFAYT